MNKIQILLVFLLYFQGTVLSYVESDSDTMVNIFSSVKTPYDIYKFRESSPFDQSNPIKLIMVSLIRMYQVIFSSQEGSLCQFRPSCSHYGALSIKRYGPIQGIFMTGDRLIRCNPFANAETYKLKEDYSRFIDNPEDHVLW